MIRTTIVLSVCMAGWMVAAVCQASDAAVETSHLIVRDATGGLSDAQLRRLADEAQETVNRILAFWSAEPGIGRFGKIRVLFDRPRRDIYSCVFYWEREGNQNIRVVRVFGTEGAPEMMAHKLTSAIFPQKDKLIRNLMGILAERHVGNPSTFPMCGFSADEWVSALLRTKSYIPLGELGPDHESWGMKDAGGGKLSVFDKPRQHTAYAETGSFANYLFQTYGVNKIKQLQRLSRDENRPFREAFGVSLQDLEKDWLKTLKADRRTSEDNVSVLLKLFESNPGTACAEAQKLAARKR